VETSVVFGGCGSLNFFEPRSAVFYYHECLHRWKLSASMSEQYSGRFSPLCPALGDGNSVDTDGRILARSFKLHPSGIHSLYQGQPP
jgi:hypothetical protein